VGTEEKPLDAELPEEPVERRQSERVPVRINLRFAQAEQAARALRAYSLNFSASGLCLRTQKGHAPGTPVLLDMTVEQMEFKLSGTVAWVRGSAIGVRFDELSDDDRLRLNELLGGLQR
jgi:uncharacterized protein (TIGR02266 family)